MSHPLYQMKICLCKMSKSKKGIKIYLCIVNFWDQIRHIWSCSQKYCIVGYQKEVHFESIWISAPFGFIHFIYTNPHLAEVWYVLQQAKAWRRSFFGCVRWNSRKCIFVCPPHCSKSIIMINLNYINILKACQKCKIFHDD